MARPAWKGSVNANVPGMADRLAAFVRQIQGHGTYDVEIAPRNDNRSSAQNRYFHGVTCKVFADYLRAQDASLSPWAALVMAKGILKDQILRTEVVSKETGELLGSYVPSTADLTVGAMAEFIDRSEAWLTETTGAKFPGLGRWVEPDAVAAAAG
jgi:hypothetical protein